MGVYRCPVCKKNLTEKEYGKALGILKERELHEKHLIDRLAKKLETAKEKAKEARKKGIEHEKAKTRRLLQGKVKSIQNLKERIKQLQKGTTPQTEGLEFEDKLVKHLKKEFPEDKIDHTGKAGDVNHTVMYHHKPAGLIVYECKRTPKLSTAHVEQTYRAKNSRKADFAVLVTTANYNRTWKGFGTIREVSVVSPFAVIPLVKLLRMHLIEMLKAKIPIQKRAKIAQHLLQHITSPDFRNPLEEIARMGKQLQSDLKGEAKSHVRTWRKRWDSYQQIGVNSSLIQDNVQLVLHGKQIKSLNKRKVQPLQLPSL